MLLVVVKIFVSGCARLKELAIVFRLHIQMLRWQVQNARCYVDVVLITTKGLEAVLYYSTISLYQPTASPRRPETSTERTHEIWPNN